MSILEDDLKEEEIMDRKVGRVDHEDDQEWAAALAIKHNIKAVPATDDTYCFRESVDGDDVVGFHLLRCHNCDNSGVFHNLDSFQIGQGPPQWARTFSE